MMHTTAAKAYNDVAGGATWETSTLRNWLQDEFYQNAFNEDEKKQIEITGNGNAENPEYGTSGGSDTEDSLFLLSVEEAEQYFADDESRKCLPTEYAKEQGVSGYEKNCFWWLRSVGQTQNNAAYVQGGSIDVTGSFIGNDFDHGIRPAMWISVESSNQ